MTTEAIVIACQEQNLRKVKSLIEGVKLAIKSKCLCECARLGNTKIAQYLLEQRTKVQNNDAMEIAIQNNHLHFVKFLVKYGFDIHSIDENALNVAIKCGRTNIVKYLISIGANLHVFDGCLLILACSKYGTGNLDIVKLLFSKGIQFSDGEEIRVALEARHFHIVRYLVSKGANARDTLSLCIAAEKGYLEMVELLVQHGANPEGSNFLALRQAAAKDQFSVVKYLLSKCKSINHIVESNDESTKKTRTYLLQKGASFRAFF